MKIFFWGTRGSLPASVRPEHARKKLFLALKESLNHNLKNDEDIDSFIDNHLSFDIKGSYGCNTSCVEIQGSEETMICDAGSGIRDLGNDLIKNGLDHKTINIFISHLHWDHIQGFPFFTPAFVKGNRINIYGFHQNIKDSFVLQQSVPNSPMPLKFMAADIKFHQLELGKTYNIGGFEVKGIKQFHPGVSYGYSFIKDGKKFIYSTDAEHKEKEDLDQFNFIKFIEGADCLVFDAQYNLVDHFFSKQSWGHSNNLIGVELSVKAKVKHLCLFHNEHVLDDHQLQKFYENTIRYHEIYKKDKPLKINLAYDGLVVEL